MNSLRSMSPLRKATIIGCAVLAVLLVASWMLVLGPRNEAVAAANAKVDVASAANESLRNQIAQRRAQEAKLPELRKVAKALAGRFPPSAEQPKLYKMVTAAAGRAGLAPSAVSNLTVSPPVSGQTGVATSAQLPGVSSPVGEIASQTVTMDVKGTPQQVRRLVGNLEQLPRAFQVTTVTLSNSTGSEEAPTAEQQTATITGAMFVMPKLADPTAKASARTKSGS